MAYNKFQKLKDNVEAIETVLRLQKEGRVADEFERFLLSNYSGFGGLKFILNPASSVEDKKYWKHSDWSYFDKVRDLYGVIHSYTSNDNEERELIDSIKRSVNTAFYTPSYIIDGIVNALSEKNIKISTMLDPSAGIGKFGESFRKTFKDMKVTSFEKDLLTGRILKALYPQDDVHIDGFETIDRSMEGKFDIVTSNIPFGDISVFDPTFKDSKNSVRRSATKAIHNYFFLKALDQVRDGGLVIFITSRGVMDSPSNEDVRREMLNNAGLVTALRLPDGMFRDEAGTEVGSDLIVLQKDPIKKSLTADEEAFVSTMESRDGITINGYYDSHSDHILTTGGVIGTDPYGKPAYVYPWDDNIQNLSCALSEKLTNAIGQSMADVIYYGYINKEVPLSQEENPQTKSELRDSGQTQPVSSVNAAASRVEQPIVSSRPQTQSRSRGKGKQKSQGGPIQLDLFADWNEQEFQTPKAQEQEPEKPLVSMEPRSFDGNRKSFYRDGITVEDTSTKQLGVISSGCTVFTPVSFERDDANRMRLYILIRDTYNDLYNIEAETRSEQKELREELNRHYDNFLLKYGRLNERRNSRVVLMDTMGRDCLTLENAVGKGFEKADIFKRPVSFIAYEIDHVDTPEEALFASLNRYGVVNLEYMSDITGHSEEEVIDLLKGRIYYNPILDVNGNSQNVKPNHLYDTAEHFLSGNIYQKLDRMEAFYADMQENMPDNIFTQRVKESIEALRLALPQQIPFDDIGLQFGERWIPVKYYEDYIGKLFDTTMEIHYAEHIDEYSLKAENRYNLKIREEYCVRGEYKEYDGMALLAHAFHDTTPDIQKCVGYDFEGNDLKGPDMEKIQLAQSKIQEIRDGFTEYLTNLPKEDRDGLQNMYNRNFNCFVKARYDGSHQTFPGIDMKALSSPKFNVKDIYKSQKDCVWMLLQNGGGICDHEVGTGKTLIMCMAAHEMHRLGIANKPMIIALKANVAEIAATYMAAFPDDKILYASEKDYSPANRVQFFNRIKNNDYACVVMSHDQFNMIPQSMEIQHQILKDEIRDIDEALQVIRNEGGNVTGRMLSGLEKRKENLEVKMLNLQHDMQNKKDDFVDFGLMGIDHIFVDESHQFKNLTFTTRHQRVSGLGNPTGSQKALNLLYAIRTIQNRTGKDLGATFLSGTTISNSLTELYLLFKYLRPKAMAEQGIHSFDSWAAVYAKKTSDYEFSVTNAVVQKERFRYFLKVPELATFYNEITDYRTGEDVGLDRPAMNVILHNIQPTADQRDFNERLVSFAQSGDGELIFRAPLTDREQKGKMLIATDASRKAALDMRLISQELFSDDPDNKASHCARLVSEYYNKYNDHKGTQFIFSDLSTYKPGEWNVFQEIKDKLVNEYNIPEHEIRFIQEAKNQKQRNAIIEAMNRGDVRVLFGSTTTLGTGVNAQKRAVAVHHIDIPWRPSDLEQRDGRARRSGNEVAKLYADNNVDIIIYAVERTLDSYKFNLLQNKQLFITQLKTNSLGTRVIDEGAMDEENGMNFAEYVAILSGNDDLLQKAKLEKKILALESERKTYMQSRRETEYRLWDAQEKLSKNEVIIKNMTEDNERYLGLRKTAEDGTVLPGLVIPNVPEYISDGIYNIEGMGVVLQDAGRTIGNRAREMGTVYGFPLIVESVYDLDGKTGKPVFGGNKFWVQGHYRYEYNYGKMALSKENRLAAVRYGVNALENIPAYIRQYQTRNEKLRVDIAEYERIAGKAWNKEEDLKSLYKEMSELEKKIQASLEATNAAIPKPKEPEYKITKEGRSHYVKFPRNAYPLVSISEMSEFAKSDDWRFRGYVRGVGYEGGRFKTMVSLDEITVDFSLRQPAEQFIEKVVAVNEERENDSRWLIEHAQQEVSDIVDIKSETVYSARQLLEERGIDWHKPLFEEAVVVENPEEIKEEAQQEEKQDVKEADNTIQIYSVGQYGVGERGEVLRSIAHQIKEFGSESSIDLAVTNYLSIFNNIPSEERNRMVLIPMPGTTGYADYMVKVVAKLCEHNGLTSVDTLFSSQHASLYDLKKNGVGYEDLPKISFHLDSPLPSGTIAVILDNVLDTGKTLSQAFEADFGEGVEVRAAVLAHTDRYKEHNPDFMIKTSDDLKQDVKKRSEQKEMLFNAALERVRSERFGEMSVLEQNSVERLMKSSWYNPFGRSIAIAKLSRMGIDWESGGKFVTPVVNLHAAERATLSAKELSMIGQVVADLATGNHLLGRPRPEGYRDLLKDVGKAFEAVGKWGLSSRQSSLLKEMSKYYHDGYADLATVIGVEEKVLKSAVSNSDSHRQVLVNNPYNIIEEDGQIVVDYEYGFGFSDDFAMMLASEYGGAFTLNEEHRQVRFNDKRTAYNFIDAVQAETERIDRRLSTALDKKLSEAGIKVHLNSKEGQHVLNANFMQMSTGEIFISNARRAVEHIQQSKATPEQWLRMIEKNGGIKLSEDRWTGLSDWLRNSQERILTKQDILDYIRENQIQVEEVHYSENAGINGVPVELQATFYKYYTEEKELQYRTFVVERGEEYANNYFGQSNADRDMKFAEASYRRLVSEYGDDFADAFSWYHNPSEGFLLSIDDFDTAKRLVDIDELPIFSPRLRYTTDGLENRREIALTVPTIDPYIDYDNIHFGDADHGRAVAWIRFGESQSEHPVTGEKERVLVIDEVQSKRHQDGRIHGYITEVHAMRLSVLENRLHEAAEERDAYHQELREKYGQVRPENITIKEIRELNRQLELLITPEERDRYKQLDNRVKDRKTMLDIYRQAYHLDMLSVPDAPFEKNWHELAMKRMLRYAIDNGFDRIAWTTGTQQAERYNIAQAIEGVEVYRVYTHQEDDGKWSRTLKVDAKEDGYRYDFDIDKYGIISVPDYQGMSNLNGQHISKVFGEELSSKIMGASEGDYFDSEDLTLGGEGLRSFYDNILSSFINKYCKQWNESVEDVSVLGHSMHSVAIDDVMREDLRNSQPMFFRAGEREVYGFVHNGEIYIDDTIATAETRLHERAHLFAAVMREKNPEEWQNIVEMMKDSPEVWNYVRSEYPHLRTDDEIADEALAQFSGRHGMKKLHEFANGFDDTDTIFGKVSAALAKFWNFVANFFDMHYTSKEEVADRILYDTLQGVKLPELRSQVADQYHFVGKKGAENLDAETGSLNIVMMNRAEQLEQSGKTPLEIKIETGWERGADGQWMMEIPGFTDFDSLGNIKWLRYQPAIRRYLDLVQKNNAFLFGVGDELTASQKSELDILKGLNVVKNYSPFVSQINIDRLTVEDFVDAPSLFAAYPELLKMRVIIDDVDARGSYSIGTSLLSLPGEDEFRCIRLNKDMVKKAQGYDGSSYRQMESTLAHEVQHYIQDVEGFPLGVDFSDIKGEFEEKRDQYRRSAGEVQARVVQLRMGLSMEERRQSLSIDYEDVPRGQQIFTYDTIISASRELVGDMISEDERYKFAVNNGLNADVMSMLYNKAVEKGVVLFPQSETPAYRLRTSRPAPEKTMTVYKTFFVNEETGRPSTLYVSSKHDLPIGVWLDAQDTYHFKASNGKYYVPSTKNPNSDASGKIGTMVPIPDEKTRRYLLENGFIGSMDTKNVVALAYRPGWHSGDLPFFPQGGKNREGSAYGHVHRRNQVVFECEIPVDRDYTKTHAVESGKNKGKVAYEDMQSMPVGGSYKYATNPMTQAKDLGAWYISDAIKINRALTQAECDKILRDNCYDPQEWEQGSLDLDALNYDPTLTDAFSKVLEVTYDDDGNLIPLSKRFDVGVQDIRYQIGDIATNANDDNERVLRDVLVERLRVMGIDVITDEDEVRRVLDLSGDMRMSFATSRDEFELVRRAAVENDGIVSAGLSSATVNVVDVPRHDFTGTFSEARKQAKEWARDNITGKTYLFGNNGGEYTISVRSVEKYLSDKAVSKSENSGVHLSVLKKLPEVIENSLDTEIHADYKKDDYGIRKAEYGVDKSNLLVHRLYGAIDCDGSIYRVKTTLHEYSSETQQNKPHSYEIAKIELLEAPRSRQISSEGADNRRPVAMTSNNSISAAKLLENVEKSYDKGKLILKESENSDINFLHGTPRVRYQKVYHGSSADFEAFDFSHMSEGEGNQTFGWGGYVSEVESIGRTYAKMNDGSLRRSRIEYEISRLEKALPFRRGEAKREGEEELRQWKKELAKYVGENKSFLYTVSIPTDNGKNYLDREGHPSKELLDKVADILMREGWKQVKSVNGLFRIVKDGNSIVLNERQSGADLYAEMSEALGSDKEASKFLYDAGLTGIVYPTNTIRGVNTDGTKNYVIFNEADMEIKDKVRLFKSEKGEAYGFTVGGKIYIDPSVATAETPIHEYTHLWVTALQQSNPAEWENVKGLLKDTYIWDETRKRYPELTPEDAIADEALATYSGRRGAERLRREISKATADGRIDKSKARSILDSVMFGLEYFWNTVTEMFGFRYYSVDNVADMVLKDFLEGRNPIKESRSTVTEILNDESLRFHFIGEKGAALIDERTDSAALHSSLSKAKELTDNGSDKRSVKESTGWEQGVDGKWRYAIGFATLNPESLWSKYFDEVKKYTELYSEGRYKAAANVWQDLYMTEVDLHVQKLGDIISNDKLFTAYPDLKDMIVKTYVSYDYSGGRYTDRTNTIGVNMAYITSYDNIDSRRNCFLCILFHEVQHAIQAREGFARGGNPELMKQLYSVAYKETEVRRWVRELEARYESYPDKEDYDGVQRTLVNELLEEGADWYLPEKEIMDKGLEYFKMHENNTSLDPLIAALGTEHSTGADINAKEYYERLAGEQEAKAVEDRFMAGFTEEDQRKLPVDYNISAEEQIVLYPDIHYADGVSSSESQERPVVEERRLTPADREAGGALVDHLEKMGIRVHTDLKEYRKAMKSAERDNSEQGNVRYFTTDSGKRYGFSYKGEMYLDLRQVDAELPLHQYARLWCQTMRKVNPDGWNSIVSTLKNDYASWSFAQSRHSDVDADDSSVAEEVICRYSGKRGAEKLQYELQRMSSRDENYRSRWSNIFQNIGKVIQDFWKHTGDSLNVEYKNVDDIADMILKDFATKVNPVKKMENWLKERDREYSEAVASGDTEKVQRMFNAALQEHVGNGITPYIAVDGYRGRMDRLARGVKSYLPTIKEKAINEAADRMVPLLSGYNADNAVLVPAPSHNGYATDMLSLANAISERTGIQVADVLKGEARQSQYELKKEIGRPLTAEELHIRKEGELPDGKLPIVVDNVVNSGNTAKACVDALGGGLVLSVASAVTQSRHVSTLKSAAPVVYDKDNNLVPLSERFTFKNRHMTPVQGMPLEQPLPYQEPDVIQGLEDFDIEDIRAYVENSVQEILDIELPFSDIYVKQVTIIGSRARGEGKEGSDLDILLEYGGSDVREDDLFNILNSEDNKISLDGIDFDINPINPKYSLSTAEWLARDARWREEDLEKNNNNQNNNVMDKNEQSQELLTKQQELLNYYTGLKSVYSKEVVLLRQKGFLEAFGKDAEIVSKKFDEPLLQRTIGEEKVPFVFFSNDKYLNMIDDTDVDLHIVSNPIHVEAMEEILPSVVGSVGVDNSVIAEELEEKEEALVGILGTRERYTFDNPPLLSVEDGIAKVYVDGYHLDEDNHVVLECERIDNAGGSETYTKGHGEYSVSDLNIVVNGLYGSKKFDIEGIARINENFKQAMSAIFARQEIEDSKNGINRIGEHEDTMNKINGMLDDILGVFSKHNDLVGDDNLVESDLTEQYERTHQLVKDLGLEYVPLTLRVPVVVNHLDEEILDDWRLEDDKAVLSHVMFSDIDEKVYVSRQNAYDDEKGVSLSELPEESQKQVLDLVEEMLNDQDRQLTVYVDTKKVPDWALNYVINGESDQLSDEDLNLVNDFLEKYPNHIFSHRDDEPSFDSSPAFGLAADTVPVDIVRTSTPRELRKERIEKEIADLKSGVADVGSTINHLMEKDEHLCYALLERMYSEVKDYLGGINPDESSLWAGNARNQVAIMGSLMMSLSEQPEWLTWDELANYTHQVSEPAESQENNLDSGINVEEKAIGYSEPTKEQGVVEDSVESGLGESERLVSGLDTEIKVHDGAPESYRKMMEESEMAHERESVTEKQEESKGTESVEKSEKEEAKPKSRWDNLDYTKYVIPDGVTVSNAKVNRFPPKEGEKYAKFVISCDAVGKHFSKEMWGNDIKAFYEKDENGKRTNRVTLDQLVAKYFGKQFAESMSIGSVQEAEHVLAEQLEEKERASDNKEQKQQELSDKEKEAAQRKAAEDKQAQEEAAKKKSEEEKKNNKKEKVPAIVLQASLLMSAFASAEEHDGKWLNIEGKVAPDFLQKGQVVSPFNALMMALHSDVNGYKTNVYTTFNAARSNGYSVKGGESGLPFNWYNWDKYVNRFNANEIIGKEDYEKLPEQEKELFKILRSKEERSIFNIDQTTLPYAKTADYNSVLESQSAEQSKLKQSAGSREENTVQSPFEQVAFLKEKHPDALIFMRNKDFYEVYGKDAETCANVLGITVSYPDGEEPSQEKAMASFAYTNLDTYLPKLIRSGSRVAICDRLEDVKSVKRYGVADSIYSKCQDFVDTLSKENNVVIDPYRDTCYDVEKDVLYFNKKRLSPIGQEIQTAIGRYNDNCRACVGYTGGASRLNRLGSVKMLPEDAMKYEQLVQELASGVMMVREGFPASLSKDSMGLVSYWQRELTESPNLMESLERDVNNAVEVLDKLKKGETVDYSAIRGEKAFDAVRPKLYTIASELATLPNVNTKEVVIVKDERNKTAAVILPSGASLEVNNEIPGMNKNRFVVALRKSGFENVRFYNAGGALGLNQSNEFFADKTIEVARLKQYDIIKIQDIDITEELERTSKVDIEKVSMTRDDKGNALLFVKPTDGESFTVYPEPSDVKTFFQSIHTQDFDNIREALGQKYYGLVLRHPDLKCNVLMPDIDEGIDLSRITKVNITKDKYKENTTVIFATIDGEAQKPVELTNVQAQRFWLVNDQDMYKLAVAAQIWQEKLSVGQGQSEDGQSQFRDNREGQGIDSGSPTSEEVKGEDKAQDNKKGGGLHL